MPPKFQNRGNRTTQASFRRPAGRNPPPIVDDRSEPDNDNTLSRTSQSRFADRAMPSPSSPLAPTPSHLRDLLSRFVGEMTVKWLQECNPKPPPIDMRQSFAMPRDVTGLEKVLDEINSRGNVPTPIRQLAGQAAIANFCSAVTAGRASDRVTVLLLGGAGQGKSQTVNKLVGRPGFLTTGQHESATSKIDSGSIAFTCSGVASAMAFDEMHDLGADADQLQNFLKLIRYSRLRTATVRSSNDLTKLLDALYPNAQGPVPRLSLRAEVFPNAVLLTSRWDDIRRDAHNDVERFSTPLGQAIRAVKALDLCDIARPNVIVVVTRALTDPMGYLEEEDGTLAFDEKWNSESQLKRTMVQAIQKKVYPNSKPWPIVFVENGSRIRDFATYRFLPDGEKSHQNLYRALRGLFNQGGRQGIRDLLGLRSLPTVMGRLALDANDSPGITDTVRADPSQRTVRNTTPSTPQHQRQVADAAPLLPKESSGPDWRSILSHYAPELSTNWFSRLSAQRQPQYPIDLTNPFAMPADVRGLRKTLDRISEMGDLQEEVRSRIIQGIITNFYSAFAVGRACNRVTVLLLGDTGQGKSATINKLVGQEIFETGRDGSTTKDINSITTYAIRNGIKVALAFDDTPGLEDTRAADRQRNATTLTKYADALRRSRNKDQVDELLQLLREMEYGTVTAGLEPCLRPETYPNAVLLTATWDSVKDEGDNSSDQLTSAMGRTVRALKQSGLYDSQYSNVVVVVTRAISHPKDYLGRRFDERWGEEADKKRRFILRIQQKLFPGTAIWPVVFVENGGSEESFNQYEVFPDGQQSHQNLFDALRILFNKGDKQNGAKDLLGLQALATVISGVSPHVEGTLEATTVFRMEREDNSARGMVTNPAIASLVSPRDPEPHPPNAAPPGLLALASSILGQPYNPVRKEFIPESLIDTTGKIQVTISQHDHLDSIQETRFDELHVTPAQLDVSHKIRYQKPPVPRLRRGRPLPFGWTQLHAYKIAAVASLDPSFPRISEKWQQAIDELPRWNENDSRVRLEYERFFDKTGTHIVVAAALGGKIVLRSPEMLDEASVASKLQEMGSLSEASSVTTQLSIPSGRLDILVIGGKNIYRTVRQALTDVLQDTGSPSGVGQWKSARLKWVKTLREDAIFLAHLPETKLAAIHSMEGIPPPQQQNLRQASNWYLKIHRQPHFRTNLHMAPPEPAPNERSEAPIPAPTNVNNANEAPTPGLDRERNRNTADNNFEEGQKSTWGRLISGIRASCVIQ